MSTPSPNNNILKGILCASIGAVSWGFSGTCSQYLFMHYEVSSTWLTTVRMLGAGLLLLLVTVPRQREQVRQLLSDKHDVIQLLFFAVTGLLLCQFAYLSAIQYSNSGTAAVLQETSILITSCYMCLKMRKAPTPKLILCIILALSGVFIMATSGNIHALVISPLALFWGMGAAAGASAYPILSESLVQRWGSRIVTGFGLFIGGTVFCLASQAWKLTPQLDGMGIFMVLVIILVGTVGAFTLYLVGIGILGPVRTKLIGCLEPLSATVIGAAWLHSKFTKYDLIGFACILVMVFIYNYQPKTVKNVMEHNVQV